MKRAMVPAMLPVRSVFALILALVVWALAARADDERPRCIVPSATADDGPCQEEVAGHYAAVSESEWTLEVWLNADGTAEVSSEGWEAGQYEERTTVRYRGSWSISGAFVKLTYRGRCETLHFDPALSFAEFGSVGVAPGLQGRYSSGSDNLFIGRSLWSAEHLGRIPEVE